MPKSRSRRDEQYSCPPVDNAHLADKIALRRLILDEAKFESLERSRCLLWLWAPLESLVAKLQNQLLSAD